MSGTCRLAKASQCALNSGPPSGWMLWNARNVYEPAKYVEQIGQE